MKSLRTAPHQDLLRLLKAARTHSDLTQVELARRIGRHQSFVAKYESGERRLEVVEFVQICRTIGTPAEWLIAFIR